MTTPPTDFRTDRLDRPGVARLRRAVRRLTGHDLVPPPDAVEAFLADMWAGDPLGEAYVDEVQDGPVGRRTARQMLDLALAEGIAAVEDPPATMAALFAEFEQTPDWVDPDLVEQGASIWRRWGTDLFATAGAETLEMYTESAVAVPLSLAGGYAGDNALRRFLETVRFWIDVSEPGALLTIGSAGRATAMRVRVMHVSVRRRVAGHEEWDAQAWGLPISQAWAEMTLMGGSIAPAALMMMLGYQTTPSEIRALLHYQRFLGHLLGVQPRWYPETVTASVQLMVLTTMARSFTAGQHGAELIESFPKAFEPDGEGTLGERARKAWAHRLICGYMAIMMMPGTRRRYDLPPMFPWVLLPVLRFPLISTRELARRASPRLDAWLDARGRRARERWYREQTRGREATFAAPSALRR